jgi:hypothetical protein
MSHINCTHCNKTQDKNIGSLYGLVWSLDFGDLLGAPPRPKKPESDLVKTKLRTCLAQLSAPDS